MSHQPSARFFIRKHETWSFFLQVRVHAGITPGFSRFGFVSLVPLGKSVED